MPHKSRDNQQEREDLEERDGREMPPIPDGGLGESMPDWLRRPPAWRTLPDREVELHVPEATVTLPEADTSVIDPREFIHDDDLPTWLRSLRRPGPIAGSGSDSANQPSGAEAVSPTKAVEDADKPAILRVDREPAAFRPRHPSIPETSSPTTKPFTTEPPEVTQRSAGQQPRSGQPVTTLALAVALVIAVVVIVLLLVG